MSAALPALEGAVAGSCAAALVRRAGRAAARGNVVRAASLYARLAAGVDLAGAAAARRMAEDCLCRLARRLRRALELTEEEAGFWEQRLLSLLPALARGRFVPQARLLFDLQKICVDHERQLYTADLFGWLRSFGGRAVKRPLPLQRQILLLKHLRSARRRWRRIAEDAAAHRRFDHAMGMVLHRCVEALRQQLRPVLAGTWKEVGLLPRSVVERVARDKLVEELLDRLTSRGLLTFSDIRDAVSRNSFKLPDLGGPWEFLGGDPLLRADRLLADRLDGVYRPGEFYLRGFQRLSAVFFGTGLGRLLTLWLLLPFGGAFVALSGLAHLGMEKLLTMLGVPGAHEVIAGPASIVVGGLFLLGLLHSARFRRDVKRALRAAGRGLRCVLVELPLAIARSPLVRALQDSPPVVFFFKRLFVPVLGAGATTLALWLFHSLPEVLVAAPAAVFIILLLFFNTRTGRVCLELGLDGLLYAGQLLQAGLLPGLFRFVVWLFHALLDALERLLYAVDEWLRFREGEGKLAFAGKAVLGLVWFLVAYVVRFVLVLLVEPQVNPIKHFPVVTVSHKLLLPTIPHLASLLSNTVETARAYTVATGIVTGIPGIFGFLAWELKENWRLYAANRTGAVEPVVVGSHGERMVHLLRPGFHSGTLKKIWTKLRRAVREGNEPARERHEEALHHVEEEIRHLVERELLALLRSSQAWGGLTVHVHAVHGGIKTLRVKLAAPRWPEAPVTIVFSEQARWLVAEVEGEGFLPRLTGEQQTAFQSALAGLYKRAGVDVAREQLDQSLDGGRFWIPLTSEGILLWPRDQKDAEAVYVWSDEPETAPRQGTARIDPPPPTLPAERLWFSRWTLSWLEWRNAWEGDKAGKSPALPGAPLLLPKDGPRAAIGESRKRIAESG